MNPASRNGVPTSELIEQTAARLFYEHGYHGTSIRDISSAAGVGIATLFHHHSSKAELLYRIMDRGFDELLAEMEGAVEGITDPTERLATVVRVHVQKHCADPIVSSIVITELRSLEHPEVDQLYAKRDRAHALFSSAVVAGSEQGEFRCERPRETARAIHSMCSGVVSWFRAGGDMTLAEVAELYALLALRQVGAPEPAVA
jgi:AcrR family transcriptional regulator